MSECIILNDASLPFPPEINPCLHLSEFFSILKEANDVQILLNRTDQKDYHWSALNYSATFSFGDWLNNGLSTEERLNIKSIMSKIACPINPEAKKILSKCIFVMEEDDTITTDALGIAASFDVPSLSFPSHDRWQKPTLRILQMTADACNLIEIKNICTVSQASPFFDKARSKLEANTKFFKKLVAVGNPNFPNLIFSSEALKTLHHNLEIPLYQEQIIHILRKLDEGIQNTNSLIELSEYSGLEISGESSATMENPKYSKKRIFTHPELGAIKFATHVKNFPNAKRMHIHLDFEKQKICIGYFGNHLPTSSDPT